MPETRWRDPQKDMARHLIKGGRYKGNSGTPFVRDMDDAMLNSDYVDDPVAAGVGTGEFTSRSSGDIMARNLAEAAGKSSGIAGATGTPIDIKSASRNRPQGG